MPLKCSLSCNCSLLIHHRLVDFSLPLNKSCLLSYFCAVRVHVNLIQFPLHLDGRAALRALQTPKLGSKMAFNYKSLNRVSAVVCGKTGLD